MRVLNWETSDVMYYNISYVTLCFKIKILISEIFNLFKSVE